MAKKIEKPSGKVRMVQPHGFIDDDGQHRHWEQGAIVTKSEDIALLIERGASIEEVKEEE